MERLERENVIGKWADVPGARPPVAERKDAPGNTGGGTGPR
jgi:hypothetical protein